MSHSTGKSSWRGPLSLNAAHSKPVLPLILTCTSMHIVFLPSLRWAVPLGVKRAQAQRIKCHCRGATHYGDTTQHLSKGSSYSVWPWHVLSRFLGLRYGKSSPDPQQVNQDRWQQMTKEKSNTHNGKMALVGSRALSGSEAAWKMPLVIPGESGKQAAFLWDPF